MGILKFLKHCWELNFDNSNFLHQLKLLNNNSESKNTVMKKIILSVNIILRLIELEFSELSIYQSIISKRMNNNGNLKWDIFFDIYGQQQLVHK